MVLGLCEGAGEAVRAPVGSSLALTAPVTVGESAGEAEGEKTAETLCGCVREGELKGLRVGGREGVRREVAERVGLGEAEGEQVGGASVPGVRQPSQGQGMGALLPAGQKLPMGQMNSVAL